jgi:hypothetical protein
MIVAPHMYIFVSVHEILLARRDWCFLTTRRKRIVRLMGMKRKDEFNRVMLWHVSNQSEYP